ncbi:MAG: S8 family serine peptidase [Planctomycetota bacterium]
MLALVLLALLAPQDQTAPTDPGLLDAPGRVPIFVRMKDQLFARGGEFPAYCDEHATTPRSALRQRALATLHERADRSFAAVAATVAELEGKGDLRDVTRFWIVNGFAAAATKDAVQALAALPEVAFVHRQTEPGDGQHHVRARDRRWLEQRAEDQARALAHLAARPAESDALEREGTIVPWNVQRVRADKAWDAGALGQGVVVALLDTGVLPVPALLDALWRNPQETANGKDDDGNGYVDDLLGWDFGGDTPYVVGDGPQSHGTMCGGIIAGRAGGEPRTLTGVAPRARLMVLRGMGSLRAYEYAASMGADVLSMSYMWIRVELGSYRGVFRTAHEHLAACGVVAVGGAGNFGRTAPEGRQIALPKDIPCVIAAAGVDEAGRVPAFSSRGPCTWDDVPFFADYPPEQPLMKPDVTGCAAGVPVWHWKTLRNGRQAKVVAEVSADMGLVVGPQGNSFAGPHAAGVAALMLSANRELTPWRIKALMEATCKDLGDPGRDVVYGAGLLQADAAVAAARRATVK